MKYVDADKLIKSVNNYQEGAKAALNPTDGDADYYKGKIDTCKDIQEFITSLQQEQPDFPITNEQIKEFLATHPKIKVPEKYKNPDWLFNEQEQPEVDLEKEIDDELDRNWRGHYIEHRRFVESAKYFYKLGLNAKNKD